MNQETLLWLSAYRYMNSEVGANGLVAIYFGVGKGLPKSIAQLSWVNALWNDYYSRKNASNINNIDFSNHGSAPYDARDIFNEINGG